MGRQQVVEVRFSQAELAQLQIASSVTNVDLESLIRQAALAIASDLQGRSYTKHELGHIYREAASRGHVWTEAELRQRHLPLHWSEAWVRARLAEGKSVKQIALLSGSPATTVGNHLQRVHGIYAYRKLNDDDIASIRQRYAAGESRPQIAADLGVSKVTVGKYLKGLPTEFERSERKAQEQLGQESAPSEPAAPHVQGLRAWSDRLFEERVQLIGAWPTSTKVIADRVFAGNLPTTRDWTGRMVQKGRLVRLAPGWFDISK